MSGFPNWTQFVTPFEPHSRFGDNLLGIRVRHAFPERANLKLLKKLVANTWVQHFKVLKRSNRLQPIGRTSWANDYAPPKRVPPDATCLVARLEVGAEVDQPRDDVEVALPRTADRKQATGDQDGARQARTSCGHTRYRYIIEGGEVMATRRESDTEKKEVFRLGLDYWCSVGKQIRVCSVGKQHKEVLL